MTFNKIVNVKRNIHRFLPLLREQISVFFEIYQRSKRKFYFHCRGKSDFSEISIQTKNIFWFCSYTILALHIFAVSKCRFYFGVSNFKRGKSDEQIFGYRKCTTDKTECNTLCLQKNQCYHNRIFIAVARNKRTFMKPTVCEKAIRTTSKNEHFFHKNRPGIRWFFSGFNTEEET